ncbi:GlyGly-CTERM sorting domain-containing protein [Paenibacillus sp. NPDC058910]
MNLLTLCSLLLMFRRRKKRRHQSIIQVG